MPQISSSSQTIQTGYSAHAPGPRCTRAFVTDADHPTLKLSLHTSLEAVWVLLDELVEPLGGDRLWPLERQAEGAVPEELSEDAVRAAHTEEDGVVVVLRQAIVLEQDTRVGVDVRVGVLGLAVLCEDLRHDLVDSVDNLRTLGGTGLDATSGIAWDPTVATQQAT